MKRTLAFFAAFLLATALTLPAPWIFKIIIDDALPHRDLHQLGWLLVAFTAIFVLRAWITFVRNRVLQYAAMRLVCDVRIQLFAHLQRLPVAFFDRNAVGRLVTRQGAQLVAFSFLVELGFLHGLLAPCARHQVGGLPSVEEEIHGHLEELGGGAAGQEKDLPFRSHARQ